MRSGAVPAKSFARIRLRSGAVPAKSFARIRRNNAKRGGSEAKSFARIRLRSGAVPAKLFARIRRNNAKRCGFGIQQNLVLEFGLARNNVKRCGSEVKPETHRFAPLRAATKLCGFDTVCAVRLACRAYPCGNLTAYACSTTARAGGEDARAQTVPLYTASRID